MACKRALHGEFPLSLDISVSMVHKSLRNILYFYSCKITYVQELLALEFLFLLELDNKCPWDILRTEKKTHFNLQDFSVHKTVGYAT